MGKLSKTSDAMQTAHLVFTNAREHTSSPTKNQAGKTATWWLVAWSAAKPP